MSLTAIFDTLLSFLAEQRLDPHYVTVFPSRHYPTASAHVYGTPETVSTDLLWSTISGHNYAQIMVDGVEITVMLTKPRNDPPQEVAA